MGDTTILTEFSTMHTNLRSKQCPIIHVGVPINLLGTTQSGCTRYFDPMTDQILKIQKGGNTQVTSNHST